MDFVAGRCQIAGVEIAVGPVVYRSVGLPAESSGPLKEVRLDGVAAHKVEVS